MYATGLNDNAEYHHNTNAMYLGFQTAASAFLKSVVVHEATHACPRKSRSKACRGISWIW